MSREIGPDAPIDQPRLWDVLKKLIGRLRERDEAIQRAGIRPLILVVQELLLVRRQLAQDRVDLEDDVAPQFRQSEEFEALQ